MTQLTNRGPNVVDTVTFVSNFVIEELRTSVFDYSDPWAVKKELQRLFALFSYTRNPKTKALCRVRL